MKFKIETIKDALRTRGYEVDIETVSVVKNNEEKHGIRVIMEGCIHPVVYEDPNDTLLSYISRIIVILETPLPDIDARRFLDTEYIRENAFFTVQRVSNNPKGTLVKSFLNLEIVGRIRADVSTDDGSVASFKVTTSFLDEAGIDEFFFWDWASTNVKSSASVKSLAEVLGFGSDVDMGVPFYVASAGLYAGAAVICTDVIAQFCREHDTDCYILPSSTEEVLLLPTGADDSLNPKELAMMVEEINNSEVSEELQLYPVVYAFHRNDGFIKIASTTK